MCILLQAASVSSAATTSLFTQAASHSLLCSPPCPALLCATNYAHPQGDPAWPQPPLRSSLEYHQRVACSLRTSITTDKPAAFHPT